MTSHPQAHPAVRHRGIALALGAATLVVATSACADPIGPDPLGICSIPFERFVDGGFERSEIPALYNPKVALRGTPDIAYLSFSDRVIGLRFNGQPLAIPHKILWWHEVVNLDVPGERRTVTYSPLTGSSLVFDRGPVAVDSFTVSSYVLETNLVLEDESGSLWPQMSSTAGCGPRNGVSLQREPYQEMTLGAWLSLHPDSWIVSSATGHSFFYTLYPYGDYDDVDNPELRFPLSSPIDPRRPPKERILGVPAGQGGIAFPLPVLAQLAAQDQQGQQQVFVWAANAEAGGSPVVAFWNSFAQTALAYRAEVQGQRLTFEVVDGQRRDVQTGTTWDFEGNGFAGPLEGAKLEPVAEAYLAFWFAWAEFQPETSIWAPPATAALTPGFDPFEPPPGPIDWELSRR